MTAVTPLDQHVGVGLKAPGRLRQETVWGLILIVPYLVLFLAFVLYPVGYGLWLGSDPKTYIRLWRDPVFFNAVVNTVVFLGVAVNVKMFLALLLSGFFTHEQRWIRWLSIVFILPWAVPSIPTILSFRWMLNAEWGMVNNLIFRYFQVEGPVWLLNRWSGLAAVCVVHIWKYLPFWTLILLAGRLAIPRDLYESADVDGAGGLQKFRYVTFPSMQNLYITCTLLSTIMSLGDFNSVYLLTGGGPADSTQTLATLGIRYAFGMSEIEAGVSTVVIALPVMIPLLFLMLRRMRRGEQG
ncbi:MAG TPA: sugar ABC transporter permease [Ferrovibrio sp.]|jgi:multiple sugar transport system permease protein|uniref:carbohydrate ABC transporter permease n=1 Tax=Ferrovibrio sp. TaxID=1917215 RepID=UPI002ED5CCC3